MSNAKLQILNINLLPTQFIRLQKENSRFYKIQTISIYIVLFLVFLASLIIALRLFQSQQIKQAQASLDQNSEKVSSLKPQEVSLVILKNRLSNIEQLNKLPSKQRGVYNLVSQVLPATIVISSVSVDRSGNMLLTLISPGYLEIDDLLTSLMSPVTNEGVISQIELESLSRSRDELYRANIKVVAK